MDSTPDETTALCTIVDRVVQRGDGHTPAIWSEDAPVTYSELLKLIEAAAWRLHAFGLRPQERVVFELDDSIELVAGFLGAIRIGVVPVLLNPRAALTGYAIEHSDARFLVTDHDSSDDEHACEVITGAELVSPPTNVLPHSQPVAVHGEDAAFWLYSSGSTGHPKAVVHLHRDIAGSCINYAGQLLDLQPHDVCFSTAKLFHAYGLGGGLLFPLWHGASVIHLRGKPGPGSIIHTIKSFGVTVLFSVPSLYNAVSRHVDDRASIASLRRCVSAAEPLAPTVWERWCEITGIEILDGVGSTEMLHIYCSNRPGDTVVGSAGVPVPGYEVQLRPCTDDPGEEQAPLEMWVRGPSAFDRYWRNQQATRAAFCGSWFRTGDCFDVRDGRYWYLGRVDDMMKIGGLWISANTIESCLAAHPEIIDNAVVSANTGGLNRIKAFVVPRQPVPRESRNSVISELRTWCAHELPADHIPHYFELVDALPRTPAGKVRRFALRETTTAGQ
ncbi:MAG: AMP-binding protein [Rhodococcus sp. (in: high G+C Gram-positive bacteria)]|uniref:AMP-binding protein n=1 Tax=Rhodococcus sp. TaxID=1831 RepID=UPI002ADA367D|nr:AMP-binding protein [Rhodococcus sp. (in: high G+C Gram-positive bacteria)]